MNGWIGTILRVDLTNGARSPVKRPIIKTAARLHRRARPRRQDHQRRGRSHDRRPVPGQQADLRAGPLHGHVRAVGRPLRRGHQGPAQQRHRGLQLRRHLRAGAEVRRLRRRDHRGQGGQAGLPVDQGRPRSRSATPRHLWGKAFRTPPTLVRAETDEDAKVACIGPAGEKLVADRHIMNEMHRAAGRTGVGAVMGSKNLKAVAVVGTGAVQVADPERFKAAVMASRKLIQAHPVGGAGLKAYGTDVLVNILNQTGALPTRNFQDGYFPTADKIGGESLAAKQLPRPRAASPASSAAAGSPRSTTPSTPATAKVRSTRPPGAFGRRLRHRRPRRHHQGQLTSATSTAWTPSRWARRWPARWSSSKPASSPQGNTDGLELTFGNADAMVEMVTQDDRHGRGLRRQAGARARTASPRSTVIPSSR